MSAGTKADRWFAAEVYSVSHAIANTFVTCRFLSWELI
jgi:hypothetical protein